MGIYDYLKMDHKKVTKLFELFKTAKTQRNKLEIFEMIKIELIVHVESEAYVFYKALEKHGGNRGQVLYSEEKDKTIKAKIATIANLTVVDQHFEKELLELKGLVENHIYEEEGAVFCDAKKVLTKEDAWILKEQMHDYREKMLSTVEFSTSEAEKVMLCHSRV